VSILAANLDAPLWSSINWPALALALSAIIAIFRFKVGMISLLAASCLASIGWYLSAGTM
jgi:chromate transporter